MKAVAEDIVENQDRHPCGQQSDDVGEKEGPSAVVIGNVGESPDVAEPDGGTDSGEDNMDRPPKVALFAGLFAGELAAEAGSSPLDTDMFWGMGCSVSSCLLLGVSGGRRRGFSIFLSDANRAGETWM